MSIMKHRFSDRRRQINSDSEQSENVLSIESKLLKKIKQVEEEELIEKIKKIEQENELIRRENLLFSRYLLRMNSSKTVETFEEYENETDIIPIKLPDTSRPFTLKKPRKGRSGWTKVSINWHDYIYAPHILRIEQERVSLAAYELEQTHLERERMQANAMITFENLEILYQTIESDAVVQRTLNHDIERRVKKYYASIGEDESVTFPAERIISRIYKHINSRISLIGYLRINTRRLDTRIEEMNTRMQFLDELNHKMDKVDIDLMKTRIIDNINLYEKLGRIFQTEKLVEYSLVHRLQKWKQILNDQEINFNSIKQKSDFSQKHFERIILEIDHLTQDYKIIFNENLALKDRRNGIIKAPTIIDYAQIIQQTKILQHEIYIWTKRINIAEMLLLQLKQSASILPSIQLASTYQHLSIQSSTS